MSSTAPGLDPREHATAVKTAISARIGPWEAYGYDDFPGNPKHPDEAQRDHDLLPPIFVLVSVERRYAPALRATGQAGRSSWRASVRAAGTTVDEAQWALQRVYEALDETRLTVDGHTSSVIQHESTTTPEPDDGRYSGLSQFTYAL